MQKRIMVVDDDAKAALDIASILEKEGFIVVTFTSAVHALNTLEAVEDIDLILTDIRMPGMDGIELLEAALNMERPVPVIVFTGFGDIDTAVNVMKAGASDFLCKPVSGAELVVRMRKVFEKQQLSEEVACLKKRLEVSQGLAKLVGKSKKMQEVYALISAVAQTKVTVLLVGETGTGKELVARAIHDTGERKDEPFVAINCAAIQSALLESELFGHEKGAFTGAYAAKAGKLECAGAGTVFLDEVGETSPAIQSKLLRVLQEAEFERVGGLKPIKLNARIVAATNSNLEAAVKDGGFRQDLYYRLNVIQIELPPLRDREGDIPLLAEHFLDVYKKRHHKMVEGFAPSAIEQMLEYHWPGNVREMQNAIERTVVTNPRRWIDKIARLESASSLANAFNRLPTRLDYHKARLTMAHELDRTYLLHFMRQEKGQIARVAELMGISTRTVSRMLERWDLDKTYFKKPNKG